MAEYYDLFYAKKSYQNEVEFLTLLIGNRKNILDVGCGTGIHMKLLEDKNYLMDGLDLNQEMLEFARKKVKGDLYCANLLDFKIDKKYDAIISMFAVFNHLSSYEEFEKGITHLIQNLNDKGILIIDLHNGRKSGEKETIIKDFKRVMKWTFDANSFIETTNITYNINNKEYHDTHLFLIYKIKNITKILNKLHLKYKLYENYTFNPANETSKNIQIVIYK
jgi:2-polyprenyl-3-methyl-5-hydroxy-6-metoxy-1,4-benzoquinol methylase